MEEHPDPQSYNNISRNTAGHEAFHSWKKAGARKEYVDI